MDRALHSSAAVMERAPVCGTAAAPQSGCPVRAESADYFGHLGAVEQTVKTKKCQSLGYGI